MTRQVGGSRRASRRPGAVILQSVGCLTLIAGWPSPGRAADPVPAVAAEACAAPRDARRALIGAALAGGYGIQYWGDGFDPEHLAAQPHGLLILELTRQGAAPGLPERRFGPADVDLIRQGGARPVLGYLNLSETEPYRDYALTDGAATARWQGGTSAAGEPLAAYWDHAWREIMLRRVDALMATGVDGIFLDDPMHYYTHAAGLAGPAAAGGPAGFPGFAAAMMDLVIAIADRARSRSCTALVVVNNAVFIGRDAGPAQAASFARYRDAVDAILIENALGAAGHADTLTALQEDFAAAGVAVLTVDVAAGDAARRIALTARAMGFAPYVIDEDSFSRLYPPVPRDPG